MRIAAASLLLSALLASATALAATGENPQFRPNPSDTAAARASTVRAADLGRGWTGGLKKSGKPESITCPTSKVKQSDQVVTGKAYSQFTNSGVNVGSEVWVLKTSASVRRDFASTMRPDVMKCFAAQFVQAVGPGAEVASVKPLPFPRVGSVSGAYRISVEVTTQGTKVPLLVDFIGIAVRRTEISLVVTAPAQAEAPIAALEKRVARLVAARARP